MAVGKNKGKGVKKGSKKKAVEPFLKKVWYNVKVPNYFQPKNSVCAGRTPVTKTQGQRQETDMLKGRIVEFNLADIQANNDDAFKKIKLEIQEIQGKSCLTDFHGLSLTRDKMCQMIKKRHTLIDAACDCKTADGYIVRIFVIGFTKDVKDHQVKVFTYAQMSQVKKLRKRIVQIVQQAVAQGSLKDLVKTCVLTDKVERDIAAGTQRIYPLDPVHVQKIKIVKKPKVDITKLMEIHDKAADEGVAMTGEDEPQNLLTAAK